MEYTLNEKYFSAFEEAFRNRDIEMVSTMAGVFAWQGTLEVYVNLIMSSLGKEQEDEVLRTMKKATKYMNKVTYMLDKNIKRNEM